MVVKNHTLILDAPEFRSILEALRKRGGLSSVEVDRLYDKVLAAPPTTFPKLGEVQEHRVSLTMGSRPEEVSPAEARAILEALQLSVDRHDISETCLGLEGVNAMCVSLRSWGLRVGVMPGCWADGNA